MSEQISKWIWKKMKLIMRNFVIHVVNAIGQRVGEIIVDEMELQFSLQTWFM